MRKDAHLCFHVTIEQENVVCTWWVSSDMCMYSQYVVQYIPDVWKLLCNLCTCICSSPVLTLEGCGSALQQHLVWIQLCSRAPSTSMKHQKTHGGVYTCVSVCVHAPTLFMFIHVHVFMYSSCGWNSCFPCKCIYTIVYHQCSNCKTSKHSSEFTYTVPLMLQEILKKV